MSSILDLYLCNCNNSQVILGTDKAFTYDSAYSPETPQIEAYTKSVSPTFQSLLKGYNHMARLDPEKTHTTGTSHSLISNENDMGVIPRAIHELFDGIKREDKYDFIIKVSFLEIYNEELHDLLRSTFGRNKDALAIRENCDGRLKITGLITEVVSSPDDVLAILCKGSLARSTGSTAINSNSSRSHAIFTIEIEKTEKSDTSNCTNSIGSSDGRYIHINKGFLALGNVINALCDKNNHIPYRDSKLTRLLQDSLGGNSHTLSHIMSRRIKNKPVMNRDPQTIEKFCNLDMSHISFSQEDSAKNLHIKALETENYKLTLELQTVVDQTTNVCDIARKQIQMTDNTIYKLCWIGEQRVVGKLLERIRKKCIEGQGRVLIQEIYELQMHAIKSRLCDKEYYHTQFRGHIMTLPFKFSIVLMWGWVGNICIIRRWPGVSPGLSPTFNYLSSETKHLSGHNLLSYLIHDLCRTNFAPSLIFISQCAMLPLNGANEIYLKQFADIQYLDMLKAEAIHKCQTRYPSESLREDLNDRTPPFFSQLTFKISSYKVLKQLKKINKSILTRNSSGKT
ncbi:Chromosome-associated kinesin KIF4B [Nymphon striatum]|nr:Chromosome-associated kinesin KIF4B [Nymphon striatum]